jgi:hypothetical protein
LGVKARLDDAKDGAWSMRELPGPDIAQDPGWRHLFNIDMLAIGPNHWRLWLRSGKEPVACTLSVGGSRVGSMRVTTPHSTRAVELSFGPGSPPSDAQLTFNIAGVGKHTGGVPKDRLVVLWPDPSLEVSSG